MGDKSAIEWTDASWNPVTGCTQISPGCDYCYALTFAERFRGVAGHPYEQGFDLKLWPERLELPLRWRKPRRIFVNSMSDLFHELVPDDFIARVFAVMAETPHHRFQVLTKRPQRLRDLMLSDRFWREVDGWWLAGGAHYQDDLRMPFDVFSHVWLGTSIELDRYAWRANYLRELEWGTTFVSAEPLLGPLDSLDLAGISWLIVGGESSGPAERALVQRCGNCGSGAPSESCHVCLGQPWQPKPTALEWVRDLRDRARAAGTAYFFKQWGGHTPKAGGRLLDGRTWDEFPTARELAGVAR